MNKVGLALCLNGLFCLQSFSLNSLRLSDQPLDFKQKVAPIPVQQTVTPKKVLRQVAQVPEAKRNDEEIDLFSIAQNLNDMLKKTQQFVKKYNLKKEFVVNTLGFLTFYTADTLLNLFPLISSSILRIPVAFWVGANTSANLKKDIYWNKVCKIYSDLVEKIKQNAQILRNQIN